MKKNRTVKSEVRNRPRVALTLSPTQLELARIHSEKWGLSISAWIGQLIVREDCRSLQNPKPDIPW